VDAVIKGGELIDANGPSRMQSSGGNADLRTEAEFAAVGKLGRCIVQHNG
jgi:hypothetical protein